VAAQQVGQLWTASLVGDVNDVDAGQQLHPLARHVLRAARSDRCVADRTRLFLCQRDVFLHVFCRQRGMHHQHQRGYADLCDGCEIPDRVVAHFRIQRDVQRDFARGAHQDGVAVSRAACCDFGPDHAGGAATVVDEHLLSQPVSEQLGDRAAEDVGAAARRVGDDHAHWFGRIRRLCCRKTCNREQQQRYE